ncbi:MAG: KH domain-containing protein [Thermodesulfobacteriota bacterium]
MKELVRVMACALVDRPDQVEVIEVSGGTTSVIELRVAKEDVGKIIGRQGHTANAIRTILNGVAAKLKKRVVLEIVE